MDQQENRPAHLDIKPEDRFRAVAAPGSAPGNPPLRPAGIVDAPARTPVGVPVFGTTLAQSLEAIKNHPLVKKGA